MKKIGINMFWNEKAECMGKEEKEKLQLERLQKRNGNKAILLEEINKTNKIDENKNKATLIYLLFLLLFYYI